MARLGLARLGLSRPALAVGLALLARELRGLDCGAGASRFAGVLPRLLLLVGLLPCGSLSAIDRNLPV